MKDPAKSAAKWSANLAGATQSITDGVNAVTMSPGAAAAKQADVWANNTMAAKAKFQRNAGAVTLQSWQQAMIQKGVQRIATGANGAQGKMQTFLGDFLPFVDRAKASLPPRGTLAQNIQRSAAMIQALSQYQAKH